MIHDKRLPWMMAQYRRTLVAHVTLPLLWSAAFWSMWTELMFPEGHNNDR